MTQSIHDWKKRHLQKYKIRRNKYFKLYKSIIGSLAIASFLSFFILLIDKMLLIIPLSVMAALALANLAMAIHLKIVGVPRIGLCSFENEYNQFSFGVLMNIIFIFLPLIYIISNR